MTRRTIELTDQIYNYLLANSLRESDILADLRAHTAKMPEARLQIAPEQGQFMALLVRLMGASQALEIGVFTGYSSLWIAQALPENGRLTALDVNIAWTRVAHDYWHRAELAERIELRIGRAIESLDALLGEGRAGTYDFAFIDAEKTEYPDYYERTLELLRPGGLIAIDNVLRYGRVANAVEQGADVRVMRQFNKVLHEDERVDISMLPVADGLTLVLKR